jgi:DNA mismatch endonuclease, patch repair protein
VDRLTKKQRSENMRKIKSKNSKPELLVRSLVHRLGYRYRLHDHSLPGRPDLVFPRRRKVIFVHGCFWHIHHQCKLAHVPASRQEYWQPKLQRNKARDQAHRRALTRCGWRSLVIWECEAGNPEAITARLKSFLDD